MTPLNDQRLNEIREYIASLPETVWTSHGRSGVEIDNPIRRMLLDLVTALDTERAAHAEIVSLNVSLQRRLDLGAALDDVRYGRPL